MKTIIINLNIRPAQLEDADQLCEIYNHYVTDSVVTFDTELKKTEAFREEMIETMSTLPYYVAEKDGKILGYAFASSWKSRCAYTYSVETSIYVHPDHKERRVGYNLYFKLLKELKKSKIHAVIAGISLPNVISVGLHEKMGFEKTAHFKEVGYKFNRWIDVGYWELIFPFKPE